MKQISVRLKPNEDVRKRILQIARQNKIKAGVVICGVGSLTQVNMRLTVINRKAIHKKMRGDFEIVSLQGTISEKGKDLHIHLSVSDKKGIVWGGHLSFKCFVKTTVELVLLCFNDVTYNRKIDKQTGYGELDVN